MTVTRYTDGGPEGWMQSPTGEFVRYEDHERLLSASLAHLDRERDEGMDRLRAALLKAKRSHYSCDDSWYQCPKHEEGSSNEYKPKDKCDCGADEFNAWIESVLAGSPQPQSGEQT